MSTEMRDAKGGVVSGSVPKASADQSLRKPEFDLHEAERVLATECHRG
jgi:hypothetical protein